MYTLFSCDIGLRHLSYAIVHKSNETTLPILVTWDLVNLDTNDVWVAVGRVVSELDQCLAAHTLTHAVLEVQMAPKMKAMYHALQMYFLCRQPHVTLVPFSSAHKLTVDHTLLDGERELTDAEIKVWERVLKRKSAYGLRKDLSVLHALHMVRAMPDGAQRVVELLKWYDDDKADDVADALLQAIVFLERDTKQQTRRRKNTLPKAGRIYPTRRRRTATS